MLQKFTLKRTVTADQDFQLLVKALDHELWNELKEDQATYDPFNFVNDIKTAVLMYEDSNPVACGCYKEFDPETVEIKRMFVLKKYRRQGLSKKILQQLEEWALQLNYRYAVLETSIHFKVARSLYENCGYKIIPNYPPYHGLEESVCMKKDLKNKAGKAKN